MRIPPKDEVKALAAPRVYERGRALASKVQGIERRGEELSGTIPSSLSGEYRISARVSDGKLASHACTCVNGYPGICKHAVAILVRAERDLGLGTLPDLGPAPEPSPEPLPEQATPDTAPLPQDFGGLLALLRARLGAADRETLLDLLLPRGERGERGSAGKALLTDLIMEKAGKGWAAGVKALVDLSLVEARRTRAPVDLVPIRSVAHGVVLDFLDEEDLEHDGSRRHRFYRKDPDTRGVDRLVRAAGKFAASGDARNAVRILAATAEGIAEGYPAVEEDYGAEAVDLMGKVAAPLARAALKPGIPQAERTELGARLAALRGLIPDFHRERDLFAAAHRAVAAGWDDPEVAAVLAGRAGRWASPAVAEDERRLAPVRVELLGKRPEEAARVAAAARTRVEEAVALVEAGKPAEALAHARATFTRDHEALALHGRLASRGMADEALAAGDLGLDLPGPDPDDLERRGTRLRLARNMRDLRIDHGQPAIVVRAARAAFGETASFEDFDRLRSTAGTGWGELRSEVLAELGGRAPTPDHVRILMSEGEHARAVAAAGNGRMLDDDLLNRTVSLLGDDHVDWVVRATRARAEAIILRGRTNEYRAASAWLGRGVEALLAAGRGEDGRAMAADLLRRYGRRTKLRPLLDAIETRVEKRIEQMERAAARAVRR